MPISKCINLSNQLPAFWNHCTVYKPNWLKVHYSISNYFVVPIQGYYPIETLKKAIPTKFPTENQNRQDLEKISYFKNPLANIRFLLFRFFLVPISCIPIRYNMVHNRQLRATKKIRLLFTTQLVTKHIKFIRWQNPRNRITL